MLTVAVRPARNDTATTASSDYIDSLAPYAAALGVGQGESISYSSHINQDPSNSKCSLIDAGSRGTTDSEWHSNYCVTRLK